MINQLIKLSWIQVLVFCGLTSEVSIINRNSNISPAQSLEGMKHTESKLDLTLLGTCWKFLKGPWRSLDHTLEINNVAQATPKVQHYRVHRDFLVCVTSPWRGFDSLKSFPQSENSTTQLDVASHHKVKALSLDPHKPCGLRSKILWLCNINIYITVYCRLWFCGIFLFSSSLVPLMFPVFIPSSHF